MVKVSYRDWRWIDEAVNSQSPPDMAIFSAWHGEFGIEGPVLQAAIIAVEKKITEMKRELSGCTDEDRSAELGNDLSDYKSLLSELKRE